EEGETEQGEEVFQKLIEKASLDKEKLLDKDYLNSISNQQETDSVYIIVRKGNKYIYSDKGIENFKLPSDGSEKLKRRGTWFNNNEYLINKYDFYFVGGKKVSIFILRKGFSLQKMLESFSRLHFFH